MISSSLRATSTPRRKTTFPVRGGGGGVKAARRLDKQGHREEGARGAIYPTASGYREPHKVRFLFLIKGVKEKISR